MKQILLFLVLTTIAFCTQAQKKSEIVQRGISIKRHYEQNIEDGEKEHKLTKEEFFDIKGDLVEIKEYENNAIDKWFKYTYDNEGNLIEETELNTKGEQKERITYKFANGVKVEKQIYDQKNRLCESKKYEYEYR